MGLVYDLHHTQSFFVVRVNGFPKTVDRANEMATIHRKPIPTPLKSVRILGWNSVKLLAVRQKHFRSLGFCTENAPLIQMSPILSVNFTNSVAANVKECFPLVGLQQGFVWDLILWWPALFRLQWAMAEGTLHGGRPARFLTKPTEE